MLRVAAVVLVMLAAAVAVIQRREDPAVPAPAERGEADALVGELARCRTVTRDETAGLDACRRIWAENRRHFFVPTRSPQLPVSPAPNASPVLLTSPERVPPHEVDQGWAR